MGTAHYLQTMYGVNEQQSLASGHPEYNITRAGTSDAGVGFSATKFIGKHWLVNLDSAISQVRGNPPARSPLIETQDAARPRPVVRVSLGVGPKNPRIT